MSSSRPPGGKHRHPVHDEQSGARPDGQTVDQEIRHIDPRGEGGGDFYLRFVVLYCLVYFLLPD